MESKLALLAISLFIGASSGYASNEGIRRIYGCESDIRHTDFGSYVILLAGTSGHIEFYGRKGETLASTEVSIVSTEAIEKPSDSLVRPNVEIRLRFATPQIIKKAKLVGVRLRDNLDRPVWDEVDADIEREEDPRKRVVVIGPSGYGTICSAITLPAEI